MLKNYFTFAMRVLVKNKFYSFLNILGLAAGIACGIIILLYLQDDLSYDKHHRKHERIYRIASLFNVAGKDDHFAVTSAALGPMMQEEYPEIEKVVRFRTNNQKILIKFGDRQFYEENIVFADSTVFDVFTHEFIHGDPKTSLLEKNSVVITEKLAKRYFGDENPLGKLFESDGQLVKVTGVIKNGASNSHLTYDALVSYSTLNQGLSPDPQQRRNQLWGIGDYTYILLAPGRTVAGMEKAFPAFFEKNMSEIGKQISGTFKPRFEPLAGIHFSKSGLQYDRPLGNRSYIYAFLAIGIFILALAAINYMNLATARSASRSKEVGMRKVLGTTQQQLVTQFLGESILLAFLSLVVALVMVLVIFKLTPFNDLIQKNLSLNFTENPVLLFGSISITLLIGLVSGLYPAFYLSAIPTIGALKGAVKSGTSGLVLRKVLVAFQFTISIGILICTLLMNRQIDYLRNKELGFQKENILLIDIPDTLIRNQIGSIKAEMLKNPNVLAATTSNMIPGEGLGKNVVQVEGKNGMESATFNVMFVGEDYLQTMGMKVVQGRDFDKARPADLTSAIIINEAAVRYLGWDQPLNKKMAFGDPNQPELRVIGVVKDFNTHSLHEPIAPMVMVRNPRNGGTLHLRLSGNNLPETMAFIQNKWSSFDSQRPFSYRFLDESFNKLYAADERQSRLIGILSYICAFISCLGLLGLSSFTISQRTKEIGIRKVLGASSGQIVYLMFKDIMVLVLLACVVASPLAYYLIRQWLADFAYQTSINPVIFVLSGTIAMVFAFLTVSFHSLRAAQSNPVESLKYE